jgi:polyisoprenoid-binding protein YceI
MSLVCLSHVNAQQRNIDTQKSTLTIHVGKTGAFSALGHEHEIHAPIHSGTAEIGAHPAVEIHVNAQELRVTDKDAAEKERAEVQKTMLGPEVLDSDAHQEIVFKSTAAESVGQGQWTLGGNLTMRGQTRPVKVQVTLKDGRYTGETTVKQTDFGITPPGKAGVRAKDEVKIEFDVRLT